MFGLLSWKSNKTLFIFGLILIAILGLAYYLYKNQYSDKEFSIIKLVSTSILLLIIG